MINEAFDEQKKIKDFSRYRHCVRSLSDERTRSSELSHRGFNTITSESQSHHTVCVPSSSLHYKSHSSFQALSYSWFIGNCENNNILKINLNIIYNHSCLHPSVHVLFPEVRKHARQQTEARSSSAEMDWTARRCSISLWWSLSVIVSKLESDQSTLQDVPHESSELWTCSEHVNSLLYRDARGSVPEHQPGAPEPGVTTRLRSTSSSRSVRTTTQHSWMRCWCCASTAAGQRSWTRVSSWRRSCSPQDELL